MRVVYIIRSFAEIFLDDFSPATSAGAHISPSFHSFLKYFPFSLLFVFHFHLRRGQNEKWWSDTERTQDRQSAKSNFLSKSVCQLQSAEGQVDNKSLTLNRQVALWLILSSSSQAERKAQTKPWSFSLLQMRDFQGLAIYCKWRYVV